MISSRFIIQQEANALNHLADCFPDGFSEAVQSLRSIKGKVICSGIGKSGHVAKKVAATLSSTGTPSFFLHPAEALHGDLGVISSIDALLIFSNSGETSELLRLVHHSSVSTRIVITSKIDSSLAFCSDVVLLLPPLPEACPLGLAPTTSTIMMMSLGDALALTLSSLKPFHHDDYHRLHPAGALGQKLLTVDQMMRKPAPILSQKSSTEEIIMRMINRKLGCIGLVDENGVLVEVVTERHIPQLLKSVREFSPAFNFMIATDTRIADALSLMDQQKTNVLFAVSDHNKIHGVVCKEDAVRLLPNDF